MEMNHFLIQLTEEEPQSFIRNLHFSNFRAGFQAVKVEQSYVGNKTSAMVFLVTLFRVGGVFSAKVILFIENSANIKFETFSLSNWIDHHISSPQKILNLFF